MKDIFKDLIVIEGVHGVIVLSAAGVLVTSRFSERYRDEALRVEKFNWEPFVLELGELAEADFLFDQRRIYLRKIKHGFLMVIMADIAPVSMVRLNCEVLLPELDVAKLSGGKVGRFLKKKIF